ncbi:MAG: aminopeptidase P family protein [Sphingomonas bacterium]|nr:aminopeptidase P family protein [Sphingomonas bacterium]
MKGFACFAAFAACASVTTAAIGSQVSPAENLTEQITPNAPAILPLRQRAQLQDRWLADRLDNLLPALMREQKIEMWVLIAREYVEDPVVATMLDAESMHARRRTILLFYDPGRGQPVQRLTVSRYGMADLFKPAWNPGEEPDQWKQLGKLIAERKPKRIAINSSALSQFADGLTLSQYEGLIAALPLALRQRIVKNHDLAVAWLETRSVEEMKIYPQIVRLAHSIIAEGLSNAVIEPGKTTGDDVVWWLREKVSSLGLQAWFQPSIGIMRQGSKGMLEGDEIIQKGDLLWTDFGISYLGLNTDTQHLAYVLKDGEEDAPQGLKAGLLAANAVQDALTSSFKTGWTGNQILAAARVKAIGKGLKPSIYSHPIGFHGHGAGSSIGFWDNQKADPKGEYPLRANTAWSIELSAKSIVPEWKGQEVEFRLEEDAFFDGSKVSYLDGRQSSFHLIRK